MELGLEGRVEARVCEELKRDYLYLRMLEHRLQMVEDQQTHSLPDSEAGVARSAQARGEAVATAL